MIVLRPGPGAKLGSSRTSGRLGMFTCVEAVPQSVHCSCSSTSEESATPLRLCCLLTHREPSQAFDWGLGVVASVTQCSSGGHCAGAYKKQIDINRRMSALPV